MTRLAAKPGAVSGSMQEKFLSLSDARQGGLSLYPEASANDSEREKIIKYLIEQHKKLPHGKQAFK